MTLARTDDLRNEDTKNRLKKKLAGLIDDIEQSSRECYPIKEYPSCPLEPPPAPRQASHPYIPGRTVTITHSTILVPHKVTLDGRLAQPYMPPQYIFEKPPYRLPPWSKPRYSSVELRAGIFRSGCDCWKKNGLQDSCERWDCGGRPECEVMRCPPSFNPPLVGVRHRNAFDGVNPGTITKRHFEAPFKVEEFTSFTKTIPPVPPIKGDSRPKDIIPCRPGAFTSFIVVNCSSLHNLRNTKHRILMLPL